MEEVSTSATREGAMRASQVLYVSVSVSPVVSQARQIRGYERLSTVTGEVGSTYVSFRFQPNGPGLLRLIVVRVRRYTTDVEVRILEAWEQRLTLSADMIED